MKRFVFFTAAILLGVLSCSRWVREGGLLEQADLHPDRRGTATLLYALGSYYELFNEDDRALLYYQRVVDRYPKCKYGDDCQVGVAKCYERMKNIKRAIEEYKKFLEMYPGTPREGWVRQNIGIIGG